MYRRPRRNRKNQAIRSMIAESKVGVEHLISPLFLVDGKSRKEEIKSLPNCYRLSEDYVLNEIETSLKLGIESFVLFPAVDDSLKDAILILLKK